MPTLIELEREIREIQARLGADLSDRTPVAARDPEPLQTVSSGFRFAAVRDIGDGTGHTIDVQFLKRKSASPYWQVDGTAVTVECCPDFTAADYECFLLSPSGEFSANAGWVPIWVVSVAGEWTALPFAAPENLIAPGSLPRTDAYPISPPGGGRTGTIPAEATGGTPDQTPSDISELSYTPSDVTDWTGGVDPGEADEALDQLADRVKALEGAGGTPGGSDTQIQYNNAGAFGGIAQFLWDGSNLTIGTTTQLRFRDGNSYIASLDANHLDLTATDIDLNGAVNASGLLSLAAGAKFTSAAIASWYDANGATLVQFLYPLGTEVDYITIRNAAAGSAVIIATAGASASVPMTFQCKGTADITLDENVKVNGNLDVTSYVQGSQLKSDVSTGTKPVDVMSTTKCDNLNADQVDGCDVNDGGTDTSKLFTASRVLALTKRCSGLYRAVPTGSDDFPLFCVPYGQNITITRVRATTDSGTATIQLYHRPWTAPYSSGTAIMSSSLVADSGGEETTSFSDATVDGGRVIAFTCSAVSGPPDEVLVIVDWDID